MRIVATRIREIAWTLDGRGAAAGRTERQGIVLEVDTDAGVTGRGEASPLPGMSRDTLDDARTVLLRFVREAPPAVDDSVEAVFEVARRFAATPACASPSARFAIETALLDALAQSRGTTIARLVDTAAPSSIAIDIVVDTAEDARRAVAAGARVLKIKALISPISERRQVEQIAAAVPGVSLRLDANRSWPCETVHARLAALADIAHRAGVTIEYVEEPCRETYELLTAPREMRREKSREKLPLPESAVEPVARPLDPPLPLPVALDESLAELTDEQVDRALRSPSLGALVLKPTLLGGFAACLALAARARAANIRVIVTHALESPIGDAACTELAHVVGGVSAHGVGGTRVGTTAGASGPGAHVGAASLRTNGRTNASSNDTADSTHEVVDAHMSSNDTADSTDDVGGAHVGAAPTRSDDGTNDRTNAGSNDAADSNDAVGTHVGATQDPRHAGTHAREASLRTNDRTYARSNDTADSAHDVVGTHGATPVLGAGRAPRIKQPTEVLVAAPTQRTINSIRNALDTRRPIALLHPALPAAELARQRAAFEAAELDAGDLVLFTSGSTGTARGVVLSRRAIEAAVDASAAHLGWRADDRWLLALSTAHAGGAAVVARCHVACKPIALLERWDRADAVAALEACTLASLVPTQLAELLDDGAWRPPARLRAVLLGGAAASPALLARAAERRVPFLATYGMTESFGQLATAPLDRAGDVGAPLVPLRGVELVAGTRAMPAPIRVRAPMLASRYLDGSPIAPEYVTGDLGFVDGGVHVVGRADDMIVTGGENVSPATVEAVLAATPGVRAVCAFAIPDEKWGQIVGAAIAAEHIEPDALAAWRAALPVHARPRELALVRELPMLATGKLDRRAAARLPREPVRY